MAKELDKLEKDTQSVIQSTDELKEKYKDVKAVLQEMQTLMDNKNFIKLEEEYDNLLKYNENAAKELDKLQNGRINLTEKYTEISKAIIDGDKSSWIEKGVESLLSLFDKTEGETKVWAKTISFLISGASEAFWASFEQDYLDYEAWGRTIEERHEVVANAAMRGMSRAMQEENDQLVQSSEQIIKDVQSVAQAKENAEELAKIEEEQNTSLVKLDEQRFVKQKNLAEERRKEGQKAFAFDIDDAIKQHEAELGEIWKFTEEGQALYKSYFSAKKNLYEGEGDKILEVQREQNDYENEVTKFHLERARAAVEEKYKEDKVALKNQLAEGLITREEYAQKEEALTISYLENEIALRNTYGKETIELEEQLADIRLTIREREEAEAIRIAALTKQTVASEKESLKTRAQQWQEYAEKVSAISQQVSEITGMVTNSLGGMFSHLSASYAQELESLNEKIAAVDEEKEAALERVALTEDQRRAREEELTQQKINLEYATSEEQKNKADERIATLQGELGAEDSINRDFESKKASLEKEKEKKEKAQKKAEKMQKRLEMGQAIVEAIGNVAQGAAKALSFGPILGPILAAVVSAAGAIQVGVMTKQLAKMEDGGLLRGKRHSAGGMRILGSNIEVEGGEYVVNRQTTQKNLGLMNYINSQHKELTPTDINSYFSHPFSVPTFSSPFSAMMEQGGQVPMLPLPTNADTQQILQAIGNINFQPRVAITDIHHAEQQMARVDEWVGM